MKIFIFFFNPTCDVTSDIVTLQHVYDHWLSESSQRLPCEPVFVSLLFLPHSIRQFNFTRLHVGYLVFLAEPLIIIMSSSSIPHYLLCVQENSTHVRFVFIFLKVSSFLTCSGYGILSIFL